MRRIAILALSLGIAGCCSQPGADVAGAVMGASIGGLPGAVAGIMAVQPSQSMPDGSSLADDIAMQRSQDTQAAIQYNWQALMSEQNGVRANALVPVP